MSLHGRFQMSAPLFVAFAVVLLSACSGTRDVPAGTDAMITWSTAEDRIRSALSHPNHSHAFWGARVVDLETGEVLFSKNEHLNMIPASNTKLYTTAATLSTLGPEFSFETVVVTDGVVSNDTLRGNLFVRGSGDPSISGRFHDGDELAIFKRWASDLRGQGIRHIQGDIVGDDNLFDDIPLGYGWSWDDEPYWYSAEQSALSFNDNCIDLTVIGTNPGEPATVSWRPLNTSYVAIVNQSQTVATASPTDESYARKRASNTIFVRSTIAPGDRDRESLSVSNATAYFVHVLRDVLELEGVSVAGRALDIDDTGIVPDYATATQLTQYVSPPLSELVAVVNKRSHNLYADQLIKTLGGRARLTSADHDSSTFQLGLAVAEKMWALAGVDTSVVQLVDGSGLSRYNLTTPIATTQLLSYMWAQPAPLRDAFVASLPVGGIDGTLAGRYPVGRARGLVRAKTGTVSNVSSLAGYVETSRGTPLAFTLMSNNFVVETDEIRDVQDFVVETLARIGDR